MNMYARAFPNTLCINTRFFRFSRTIVKRGYFTGKSRHLCSRKGHRITI